jgi:glycosyltransferase involved in cell wall biosynthesis
MADSTRAPLGQPLVSVVIPTFNAGATIARTLESVIAQTYANLEILVVDDGSTDASREIATHFASTDRRIRILVQGNAGVAAARNRGLREARGAYVAPVDADDVWRPENVAKQIAALESVDPAVPFSFAASFSIDEFDRARTHPRLRHRTVRTDYLGLLRRNAVGNGSAAIFRREALLAIGGYDETLKARGAQGAEDWKVLLQLAAKTPAVAIPDELIGYRVTPGAMSMDPASMTRSTMLVIEEMRRSGPQVAPWHYWHARTTIHIGMFYRWVYAGRWDGALWCFAKAYLANPLWFTQHDARDFLFKTLIPHLFKRLTAWLPKRAS